MKKLLIVTGLITLVFTACKKDSFDYQLYQPAVGDIDSLYFSTGSSSLIADGKAALQFVVEAYRTIQVTGSGGIKKDSMVFVDYKKLPEGSLTIVASSGPVTGMEYSTTSTAGGTVNFYAQIGNVKSQTKTVTLRDKQILPSKLTVDVVFHVFERSPNDETYDVLTYQPVTQDQLETAIEVVNNVFNNKLGNDANGGVANIEFRLAERNASGATLPNPGYNMITYDKSWMVTVANVFVPDDFWKKVNATASYMWDPSRYLNIYVIPSGANEYMGDVSPKYQIVQPGDDPIPGIANIISDASELPTDNKFTTYGVGVPRTLLFPGVGRRIELSPYLGTYYGLKSTSAPSGVAVVDYCNDTKKYVSTNQFQELVKVGIDGDKFLANNAMDDNRYPSLRNSLTLDQVNRVRAIMENCPNRNHGH